MKSAETLRGLKSGKTLRTVKSAGTLGGLKSGKTLRTVKSAGTLRGSGSEAWSRRTNAEEKTRRLQR